MSYLCSLSKDTIFLLHNNNKNKNEDNLRFLCQGQKRKRCFTERVCQRSTADCQHSNQMWLHTPIRRVGGPVQEVLGTEFPRFKKIKVNGDDADPLYKFLQEQKGFAGWDPEHNLTAILDDMLSKADPDYKQKPDIKWNFTKFLINKKGQVVARFEPTTSCAVIEEKIKELL